MREAKNARQRCGKETRQDWKEESFRFYSRLEAFQSFDILKDNRVEAERALWKEGVGMN